MMIDYVNQEYMKKWASERIENIDFGLSTALGIVKDDRLICVVIYSHYIESPNKEPISVEVSIASIDKTWCNRHTLKQLLAYPFIQLRVKRVQATVARSNKSARFFLNKLGFMFEGHGREAWPTGGDAAVYSLLKPECKWLNHGQKRTLGSSSTRSSGNVCSPNGIQ